MKIAWITGVLSAIWNFILPLLKSKVAEFMADKEVQQLAYLAVLEAAKSINNSNDDRHQQAVIDLQSKAKAKGKELALGVAATIVEAAFQKLKSEGELKPKESGEVK